MPQDLDDIELRDWATEVTRAEIEYYDAVNSNRRDLDLCVKLATLCGLEARVSLGTLRIQWPGDGWCFETTNTLHAMLWIDGFSAAISIMRRQK